MKLEHSRWTRHWLLIAVVVVVLATPTIYGCGPWFEEAIFIPGRAPQTSQVEFAAGKLGIVLPTMRRSYLVVAYRYLTGMKLTAEQQREATDVWNRNMGPTPPPFADQHPTSDEWLKARARVEGVVRIEPVGVYAPVVTDQPYQTFLNCPDDAFKTAERTLDARVQRYGARSAAVKEWLAAQDQVFTNCDAAAGVVPAAVVESTDPLLRADRNYQIAAALFYQRRFDEAAAAFDAVAKDKESPWALYGEYLAARAIVRKATLTTTNDGKFEMAGLRAAQANLQRALRDSRSGAMREAVQRLLDYVRFRTEPEKRVVELEQLMTQPDPGPDFKQHLWDYVLVVSGGEQAGDLSDWIKTFYTDRTYGHPLGVPRPSEKEDAEHAMERWREEHSLAWLIAALDLSDPKDASTAELLKAAEKVPVTSPGYISVRYYALRTMARRKEQQAARKELDSWLSRPESELPHGTSNLFNDERQKLSTSLPDFLTHAAEVPAQIGSDMDGSDLTGDDEQALTESAKKGDKDEKDEGEAFFNEYSAQILAQRMPLELLVESAQSPTLPAPLRRELARSTWTRATVLGNMAAADQLQPVIAELDKHLWNAMEPFRSAKTNEEKRFAAAFVTLQNPGLSPYVRTGLLRSATLGEIGNFRDNWWCEPMKDGSARIRTDRDPGLPAPSFLSVNEMTQLGRENGRLAEAAVAPNFLADEVLGYARSHPSDERVPQTLHLVVRSTRYGCTDAETTKWSEKSFRLLHEHYPKSGWTMKTKYRY